MRILILLTTILFITGCKGIYTVSAHSDNYYRAQYYHYIGHNNTRYYCSPHTYRCYHSRTHAPYYGHYHGNYYHYHSYTHNHNHRNRYHHHNNRHDRDRNHRRDHRHNTRNPHKEPYKKTPQMCGAKRCEIIK